MKQSLAANKQYKNFIKERDKALDAILLKYQRLTNAITKWLINSTKKEILSEYAQGKLTYRTMDNKQLHARLLMLFDRANRDLFITAQAARRSAHVLASVGEAEALGRTTGKKAKADLKPQEINYKQYYVIKRVLNKLLRNVYNKVELALFKAETHEEFIEYLDSAFPKPRKIKRPKRKLKPIREADKPFILNKKAYEDIEASDISSVFYPKQVTKELDMTTGIIGREEWESMVHDYTSEMVDPLANIYGRSSKDVYDVLVDGTFEEVYGWEIEQMVSSDYVRAVREGQVDIANKNGYTDFVWIAVLDNKTCDDCCDGSGCSDRDGLTSSEIEKKFGEPLVPPAHENCRCALAPYQELMEDIEVKLPDYGDFDEWINS